MNDTITITPDMLAGILTGQADAMRQAAEALALAARVAGTVPAPATDHAPAPVTEAAPAPALTVEAAPVSIGADAPSPAPADTEADAFTFTPAAVSIGAPTPAMAATVAATAAAIDPEAVMPDPPAAKPRPAGKRRSPMNPEAAVIAVVRWARDDMPGMVWTMDDAIAGLDPIMGKHLTRDAVDTATERGWIAQTNAPAKRNKRYTYPGPNTPAGI